LIGVGVAAVALAVARSVWGQISIMDLGTLGGPTGNATGIDNGERVCGASDTAGDVTSHPFLWIPNSVGSNGQTGPQMIDLAVGSYGQVSSSASGHAVAVNQTGQVALTARIAVGAHVREPSTMGLALAATPGLARRRTRWRGLELGARMR